MIVVSCADCIATFLYEFSNWLLRIILWNCYYCHSQFRGGNWDSERRLRWVHIFIKWQSEELNKDEFGDNSMFLASILYSLSQSLLKIYADHARVAFHHHLALASPRQSLEVLRTLTPKHVDVASYTVPVSGQVFITPHLDWDLLTVFSDPSVCWRQSVLHSVIVLFLSFCQILLWSCYFFARTSSVKTHFTPDRGHIPV